MGLIDKLRGTGGKDTAVQPPPRPIVAAAMPMSGPAVRTVAKSRKQATTDEWQTEAWYFFDVIGEVRGPMVWIANAISQAELYATEIDPDTGKPTGPSDDPTATAAALQVLGGPSKRSGLLRIAALCWQCVGEYWLIVRPSRKAGKPDEWLVLSGSKVKAKSDAWTYTDPFTGQTVSLAQDELLVRAWSPHPEDQARADSAMRPALVDCREIEKTTQNIAARLSSRIALNGLGALAEELDFPKGDHETSAAAFMDTLMAAAEANLQNPGQASAQVPILFQAPTEMIASGGAFAHYDISTEVTGTVVEIRDNALRRLAAALDMPKDVAEGTQGESNHWSAWQVEESTYKIFIEPLLKTIGDIVSEYWFRPALIAMGMAPERAEQFELGWDTTAIVARPDDTENLRDLHDRLLISDEYLLAENGVPEDARPDNDEYTRRLLEKIVTAAPTLLSDPNVAAAMGLIITPAPAATGAQGEIEGSELVAPEPAPTPNALPATQGEEPEPENVPEGLVAAAELIVMQSLDRAGGRLLTNQNRGQFKSVPRHELYLHIRPTEPRGLVDIRFSDTVAETFGARPAMLRAGLSLYLERLLTSGEAYDRDTLRWYLR